MFLRIVLILFLICLNANAKHLYPEKYYQNIWCEEQKGRTEVKLIDNTRIDCLTKTEAVEFDFASKWAEAIGQSLHYSYMTGKAPAIVLIIEKNDDFKYYTRIKPLCEKYEINLYYMTPPEKIQEQQQNSLEQIYSLIKQIVLLLVGLIKNFL